MKKIFLLFLFLSIFCYRQTQISFAQPQQSFYAKVEGEGYFYESANSQSALFQIPTSYFVLLTGEADETFYKASYQDLNGFVKKSEVTPMSGSPTSPFPLAQFRNFLKSGLGLYSQPSSSSNLLSTIPYLYENLDFYGYMTGEADIPKKSTQWYYCAYQQTHGYVYSVFCDELPKIDKNTETFAPISPEFSSFSEEAHLSKSSLLWIILGVGIPSVIVLALLIKPTIINEKILSGKVKRKAKKDYFEFDDSSLN